MDYFGIRIWPRREDYIDQTKVSNIKTEQTESKPTPKTEVKAETTLDDNKREPDLIDTLSKFAEDELDREKLLSRDSFKDSEVTAPIADVLCSSEVRP